MATAFKKNPIDLLFYGDSQMGFMSNAASSLINHYNIEGINIGSIGINVLADAKELIDLTIPVFDLEGMK